MPVFDRVLVHVVIAVMIEIQNTARAPFGRDATVAAVRCRKIGAQLSPAALEIQRFSSRS